MIKVLGKVDAVLETVRQGRKLPFSEIQRRLGLNKATLWQILKSMNELGWLRRDEDGDFMIGRQLIVFARSELGREALHYAASEAVAHLAAETGEMASVSILDGDRRVRLAKKEGENELLANERAAAPGEKLSQTATGRLLLAFQPIEFRRKIAEKEVGPEKSAFLLAELDGIKESGMAMVDSPNGQIRSYACPVSPRESEEVMAAIGISVPAYHCTKEREGEYLNKILAAARLMARIIRPV